MPTNFEHVSDARYMMRAGVVLTGAAVVGTGIVVASLVIGSGATVAELGSDVWRSTEVKRRRVAEGFRGVVDAVGDDLSNRRPFRQMGEASLASSVDLGDLR